MNHVFISKDSANIKIYNCCLQYPLKTAPGRSRLGAIIIKSNPVEDHQLCDLLLRPLSLFRDLIVSFFYGHPLLVVG